MSVDLPRFTAEELTVEQIDLLIGSRTSYLVVAVSNVSAVATKIEGRIEKAGLRCRVFTEYRAATLAGAFFSPTAPVAWVAGLGMAAHNLATLNPDYEIGKNKLAGTVTVTFKK